MVGHSLSNFCKEKRKERGARNLAAPY